MTRQTILENFSARLRDQLKQRFRGRLPSAAAFATQFNWRVAHSPLAISDETARRWIRGNCLPDETRLPVLVEWLGLDLQQVFAGPGQLESVPALQPADREVLELFSQVDRLKKQLVLDLLRSLASGRGG